jgi:hypothetical protein
MSGLTAAAPAIAMGSTSMAMVINPIEAFFNTFNTNPFFIGVMMLLLNLGGRFLGMEISKNQERFMQHPWVRRFFIFTVLFVATRNILAALFLTILIQKIRQEYKNDACKGKSWEDIACCDEK